MVSEDEKSRFSQCVYYKINIFHRKIAGAKNSVNISVSLANTGVTAGTYGESSSATLTYGAEFAVPLVAVDPKGRITSAAATKLRMPATPVTSINGSTGAVELFTAGTGDLTAGSSSLATGKLYFVYE